MAGAGDWLPHAGAPQPRCRACPVIGGARIPGTRRAGNENVLGLAEPSPTGVPALRGSSQSDGRCRHDIAHVGEWEELPGQAMRMAFEWRQPLDVTGYGGRWLSGAPVPNSSHRQPVKLPSLFENEPGERKSSSAIMRFDPWHPRSRVPIVHDGSREHNPSRFRQKKPRTSSPPPRWTVRDGKGRQPVSGST